MRRNDQRRIPGVDRARCWAVCRPYLGGLAIVPVGYIEAPTLARALDEARILGLLDRHGLIPLGALRPTQQAQALARCIARVRDGAAERYAR